MRDSAILVIGAMVIGPEFGPIAGVLALTSAKSGSLVGVFISVTTVPLPAT